MAIQDYVTFFTKLFIIASIFTSTIGELGSGVLGRVTIADISGIIALFAFFLLRKKVIIPKVIIAYFFFLFTIAIGLITSLNPSQTIVELMIHAFLGIIFIIIINSFASEAGFKELIMTFVLSALIASFIGIWDVMAPIFGVPQFIPRDPSLPAVAVSTFRNSGQAGAYILLFLSVLLPLKQSKLIDTFKNREKRLISITVILSIIFLLLTVKIAAYIGFAVGVCLFLIRSVYRVKGSYFIISLLIIVLMPMLINILGEINPSWADWYTYKIQSRIESTIEDSEGGEGGFLHENWTGAIRAFSDNLILGSGLGAFAGIYEKYEVHSTYLKVLGETGLFGVIGYAIFMTSIFALLLMANKNSSIYEEYICNLLPFFIGCAVSWSYTYHVRKREFWIALSIMYVALYLSRKIKYRIK